MKFDYTHYLLSSYQYPDLGLLIEFETAQASSSEQKRLKSNKWTYLVGAVVTVGLMSLGLWTNLPNLEQANQENPTTVIYQDC